MQYVEDGQIISTALLWFHGEISRDEANNIINGSVSLFVSLSVFLFVYSSLIVCLVVLLFVRLFVHVYMWQIIASMALYDSSLMYSCFRN